MPAVECPVCGAVHDEPAWRCYASLSSGATCGKDLTGVGTAGGGRAVAGGVQA